MIRDKETQKRNSGEGGRQDDRRGRWEEVEMGEKKREDDIRGEEKRGKVGEEKELKEKRGRERKEEAKRRNSEDSEEEK